MANIVKYNNQTWTTPEEVNGERLSTNGCYTGQHLGSVLQDAAVEGVEAPYEVEESIVRYGTMTQDAIAEAMPTVAEGE